MYVHLYIKNYIRDLSIENLRNWGIFHCRTKGERRKKMEAILETTEIDISSRFNCDAERSLFAGKENKEEEENVVAFLEGKFLLLLLFFNYFI